MDDMQKTSQKLASLAMDVFLDIAMNNLSDTDLSFWLELSRKYGEDSAEPLNFLQSKIPNFENLYQDALKQELNSIKK